MIFCWCWGPPNRLAASTRDASRYHKKCPHSPHPCLSALVQVVVDKNGKDTVPLARYAARYWATHALVENVASCIRDRTKCLFDLDKLYLAPLWVQLHCVDDTPRAFRAEIRTSKQPGAVPLYYVAVRVTLPSTRKDSNFPAHTFPRAPAEHSSTFPRAFSLSC